MMVVTKNWGTVAILSAILLALSIGLYFVWFRHLSSGESPEAEEGTRAEGHSVSTADAEG
jgi:hypothetical protein